jgi:hypothetical protein
MTTKAEATAALAMSPGARVPLNLRDIDSFRSYIRRILDAGEFERGAVVDLYVLAEDAEEAGVTLSPGTDEPEIAAAVLLEGLLLVSNRGTQARSFQWPGTPDSASRGWVQAVAARREKIQAEARRIEHSNT